MKRFTKIMAISVAFVLLCTQLSWTSIQAKETEYVYTITTPYEYPIKPGEAEWAKLDTHDKKIEACQIPDDTLSKMSTEALIVTVMNYPLLIDMLAWTTQLDGYYIISQYFNGIKELESRDDAVEEFNKYYKNMEVTYSKNAVTEDSNTILKPLYAEAIKLGIETNYNELVSELISSISDITIAPMSSTEYVYTPKGSRVKTTYDKTWADAMNTEAALVNAEKEFVKTYTSSTLLRSYNIKYNCHSYAWYLQSETNKYWIDDPSIFMRDGSYSSTIATEGGKIFYDSALGSNYDHSGIVKGVTVFGNIWINSKWGESGLFYHKIDDCPYSSFSPTISYWK